MHAPLSPLGQASISYLDSLLLGLSVLVHYLVRRLGASLVQRQPCASLSTLEHFPKTSLTPLVLTIVIGLLATTVAISWQFNFWRWPSCK
jgi:hypothetical protein